MRLPGECERWLQIRIRTSPIDSVQLRVCCRRQRCIHSQHPGICSGTWKSSHLAALCCCSHAVARMLSLHASSCSLHRHTAVITRLLSTGRSKRCIAPRSFHQPFAPAATLSRSLAELGRYMPPSGIKAVFFGRQTHPCIARCIMQKSEHMTVTETAMCHWAVIDVHCIMPCRSGRHAAADDCRGRKGTAGRGGAAGRVSPARAVGRGPQRMEESLRQSALARRTQGARGRARQGPTSAGNTFRSRPEKCDDLLHYNGSVRHCRQGERFLSHRQILPGSACRSHRRRQAVCRALPTATQSPHRFPCAEAAAGRSITGRTFPAVAHWSDCTMPAVAAE